MKRILHKTLVQNAAVRAIFKSKPRRPKSPAETVAQTISLLTALHSFDDQDGTKRFDKARKDAAQVVANLQSQPVNSCLIASDYLAENLDILDNLIIGYEDSILALHYGSMLKKCIRHQVVARYVLKPEHVKRFFGYVQVPEFDVAADATSTFEELLTRHKSTVAEFLSENYDWLLGEILLDRSNCSVMVRYVSSLDNMMILMNLLRFVCYGAVQETSKSIQLDAFHVFKLFVANKNRPAEIASVLANNKDKLLRLLEGLKTDKGGTDKAEIMKEITQLDSPGQSGVGGDLFSTPFSSSEALQGIPSSFEQE
nr:putative MO25-like protein At5g47540 [Ipomoea trifida]